MRTVQATHYYFRDDIVKARIEKKEKKKAL